MPPCSPETTFVLLKASSKEVFPWSTCPIIVTIGGLGCRLDLSKLSFFSKFSFIACSKTGTWPNSLTIYSAVSLSIEWLIVAFTPIFKRNLIIFEDCSAILLDNSWIVICFGIFTSLITFLNSFFISSPGFRFFFSFNLALFTDAKLRCLISNSSTSIALDIVSLCSLLEGKALSKFFSLVFSFFFWAGWINLFVACCSANFLAKFFLFGFNLLLLWFIKLPLFVVFLGNLFFSGINTFFSPLRKLDSPNFFLSNDVEIVSVFFFLLSTISILEYNLSSRHNQIICLISGQSKVL